MATGSLNVSTNSKIDNDILGLQNTNIEIRNKIGITDISGIGDGTVTGSLIDINTKTNSLIGRDTSSEIQRMVMHTEGWYRVAYKQYAGAFYCGMLTIIRSWGNQSPETHKILINQTYHAYGTRFIQLVGDGNQAIKKIRLVYSETNTDDSKMYLDFYYQSVNNNGNTIFIQFDDQLSGSGRFITEKGEIGTVVGEIPEGYSSIEFDLKVNNVNSTVALTKDIENVVSDAWDRTKTYTIGEYSIYNNSLWKCLVKHTNQIPSNGTYWIRVSVGSEINSIKSCFLNNTVELPTGYIEPGKYVTLDINTSLYVGDIISATYFNLNGVYNEYISAVFKFVGTGILRLTLFNHHTSENVDKSGVVKIITIPK